MAGGVIVGVSLKGDACCAMDWFVGKWDTAVLHL